MWDLDISTINLTEKLNLKLDSIVEDRLVEGIYMDYEWNNIKMISNGRFLIGEGEEGKQWCDAIRERPHFASGNTITPSYVIRGRIKMKIDSWAEYPDSEAVQSILDGHYGDCSWKDLRRSNGYVDYLRSFKFRPGHFMQFSSTNRNALPGVLCLIAEIDQGIWEAELHFPSKVELDTSAGVFVGRSCQWYESDMVGNWLTKAPSIVMCEATRILGIFT